MIDRRAFSTQSIPNKPGVYAFRNTAGTVIYVGKARSLRKRMASYFQPSKSQKADPKLRSLINSIAYYDFYPVESETEALLLESRLIKQYAPRYNVDLRDDKRFLLICIDPSEPFPRLRLTRIRKDDGRLYFGPFPQARVLRQTVLWLARHFCLRTCKVRNPEATVRRHCMEHVVRHCCCPCVGNVTPEEYHQRLQEALAVLSGNIQPVVDALTVDMARSATALRFEDAARTRDTLENVRHLRDVQRMRSFQRATLPTASHDDAVPELQKRLGMAQTPNRIECFDISNIGGLMAVGSMVCFVKGRPAKRDYRRYRIRTVEGANDLAMMQEVIDRRYRHLVEEGKALPDLIVIDGGAGQLNAALAALAGTGAPPIPMLGLAKKHEQIHLPGRRDPLQLSRHDSALRLLQAIRDEAHRFALAYHHVLRRQRISDSLLAEIDGIGQTRRQKILQAFGSITRLRRATTDEIVAAVPGIGRIFAQRIVDYLKSHSAANHG